MVQLATRGPRSPAASPKFGFYSAPQVVKGLPALTPPQEDDTVSALRKAVQNADWSKLFAEKKTRTLSSPAWAAHEERCKQLRAVCKSMQPTRVLEIGSFVGLSTLSMAQVLPDDCEIVTLEIDPFAVDFGLDIKVQSDDFWKINHMVGPAWESLQSLIQQMQDAEGAWEPFDLAVIDADKAGMMEYFAILTEIPGFMSDNYVVCVDVKPFKGQLCTQKPDKNDSWLVSRGQTEIDEMRRHVTSSGKFEFHEEANLLKVCRKVSFTMAINPLAAFPNCYSNTSGRETWAAPQEADHVAELRKAVNNSDWANMFADRLTQNFVAASWSATDERCEKLQSLIASSEAENILEIGSFCGVASLAMAECLPEDGHILSLEIDPFLVKFGQDIKGNIQASNKIRHMVGPALESLKTISLQTEKYAPFDFVVIDADKASMLDYFKLLWESPGMVTEGATICIDITPFKGQLFVPYVKGKMDDWIVKSGEESITSLLNFVRSLNGVQVSESNGLVILRKGK
jgi:caffeoyl-CoA O-methyltransferase